MGSVIQTLCSRQYYSGKHLAVNVHLTKKADFLYLKIYFIYHSELNIVASIVLEEVEVKGLKCWLT